jgi:RNA polymerase sigma-70 factor (ECF subfamily)
VRSTSQLVLARRAGEGDPRATRQMVELVTPRVVRAVGVAMGPAHPDLDDTVQLALLGLVRALPSFRGECTPTTLAVRIAYRTASRQRRRAARRRARETVEIDLDTLVGVAWEPHAAERTAAVRALLGTLPGVQADALTMRVALGWSVQEIARSTSAPVNTVRSRLRLAKRALRSSIAADPALAEPLDHGPAAPDRPRTHRSSQRLAR